MQKRAELFVEAHGAWHGRQYIVWIIEKAAQYREARGIKPHMAIEDHDDFTEWLEEQVRREG